MSWDELDAIGQPSDIREVDQKREDLVKPVKKKDDGPEVYTP